MYGYKTNLIKLTQWTIASCALFATSCATPERPDPLEPINRVLYGVDRVVDRAVVWPIAKVYDLFPNRVHTSVGNFFSNTFEPAVVANDILQGDINDAVTDTARFILNTTFGVGGLFDFATHIGLVKHYNDFGITLAKWGIKNSAYLYIPCIGPMTIRDTASLAVDYWLFNPISYIHYDKVRLSIVGVGKVHWRWRFLPVDKVIRESFDPYVFTRDAFLQKRRAMINEVVVGHHSPEDTFVHELEEEPIITDEDLIEAEQKNEVLEQRVEHKPITKKTQPIGKTPSELKPTTIDTVKQNNKTPKTASIRHHKTRHVATLPRW